MAQQSMQPSRIPTDKVLEMRAQGVTNNQIIQILQREGYDLPSIFNAMNQADIKGGIDSGVAEAAPVEPQQMQEFGGPTMPQQSAQQGYEQIPMLEDTGMMQDTGAMQQEYPMQQPMEQPMQQPQMRYQAPMGPEMGPGYGPGPSFETQRIEELAEAIIDEKWNEIVRSINKIIDWKERVEMRVTKIEQQVDDLKKNFDTLHTGVLGKLTDYDKNLTNVGAEIKAMDKVFQKVLPSLTESVGELSRISSSMKKK